MARPEKVTPDVKQKVVELLESGNTVAHSAELCGITPTTVMNHRKKDKEFDHAVRVAMAARIDVVADSLYVSAVQGNVTAQIFFLINRTRHMSRSDSDKWMDVRHIEADIAPLDVDPGEVATRIRTLLEVAESRKKKQRPSTSSKPKSSAKPRK